MKQKFNHINFLDWELFTRENEIKHYRLEKEKRENLYEKIKTTIQECKEEANSTNTNYRHLIHEKLFGDTNLFSLQKDFRIPPQHLIQYYLKAINPKELDSFHKDNEFHLSKNIVRTNNQIEYLHRIKSDKKWQSKYEKRNFLRFISKEKVKELEKEYEKMQKIKTDDKITEEIILRNSSILNGNYQKELDNEIEIVKIIDENIKKLGYDKYNLTEEQKVYLNSVRKNEILRRNIIKQTSSNEDLLMEQKNKKNKSEIKVNFFNNNENAYLDGYDLTYEQKKKIIKKENIKEDFTEKDIKMMETDIENEKKLNKKIREIKKRKEIEDSLRRKKKYHLPEMKKMKTSLDKYSNEDEYYFIKKIKENGITLNRKEGNKKIKI